MTDFVKLRDNMVENQIKARGVHSELVLNAMRNVSREAFLPKDLREFAYEDTPLPIGEGQTISQPYIVALMAEVLLLQGNEKVLEIGAGSGYAAAVLAEIASEVYTIERIGQIATKASATLKELGYENVHVLHADGTRGWPVHSPYDAIVVAAGGPEVPESLKKQLKIGGRLVIPIGSDPRAQELVRVTRTGESDFEYEDIADVRFVPLIGQEGWDAENEELSTSQKTKVKHEDKKSRLVNEIKKFTEQFDSIETANLQPLLQRIGDARVVLLGEASHGTDEFYRMRERISRELITKKGFNFIAIEGDWPDASRIDHYVRHFEYPASEWTAFARFPVWMWRNTAVRQFIDWLREYNKHKDIKQRVAFHGLDLYSLFNSIRSVLDYLDEIDPPSAAVARERYGCLNPWQKDPATYGRAAISGVYKSCEKEVVQMLKDILHKHSDYTQHDGERFLDTVQNARLVANAERYYRIMYYGSRASWNLRDSHMFETLQTLLKFYGENSKGIVWAHNSHIGDASATEMFTRGEYNIGYLCRQELSCESYNIGFGTDSGTVAAASDWDGPMEVKQVRPSIEKSYERIFHQVNIPSFLFALKNPKSSEVHDELIKSRLERAIGVIYRPETELASHYFHAVLPKQFDEYIWFDKTHAVNPFQTTELEALPDTYPFGL